MDDTAHVPSPEVEEKAMDSQLYFAELYSPPPNDTEFLTRRRKLVDVPEFPIKAV